MKTHLFFLFLIICTMTMAQDCNCEDELNFVVNYYEKNLPAFKDNVNQNNLESYENFKSKLFTESQENCNNKELCFKTLLFYVEYFQDNHSSIYMDANGYVNEKNENEVRKFLQSKTFTDRESIPNFLPLEDNGLENIENIYQNAAHTYTIAILKNKKKFRDYVGVILESQTPLWKKGQIKFELKKIDKDTYNMFIYSRNHSPNFYRNVKLKNGILKDSWFNVNLKEKHL